ncbi:uncharacterized protein [Nicotiana tomentosiformis]|uniref:uncharacterized protein n=1 Tax=Nicotiana tomentosiformis TaxID=4098 RepID=UPI00388CA1E8
MPQQGSRAMVLASVALPPAQPARCGGQAIRGRGQTVRGESQPARGRPRGVGRGGRAQPHFYTFLARLEAKSSNVVITEIIPFCHRYSSVLFDPGSTYSYVSSYFASYLIVPRDSLSASVYVSTLVGYAIVVDRIYRSCVGTIRSLETNVYLLFLDMVDFDVILGMDWLLPYHAILDCHIKMVTLSISRFPLLERRGTPRHSTSRVISYVKARRMVENGCLAYLAYIHDSSPEVPSMDSVLVVREFPEVFLVDLPGIPPDKDIDFFIDLARGT